MEVKNEEETTLNRANGNLTIRRAPPHLSHSLALHACLVMIVVTAYCYIPVWLVQDLHGFLLECLLLPLCMDSNLPAPHIWQDKHMAYACCIVACLTQTSEEVIASTDGLQLKATDHGVRQRWYQ